MVPNFKDPQEFNRYSYVTNNPINHTDPTGRCSDYIDCGEPMTDFSSTPEEQKAAIDLIVGFIPYVETANDLLTVATGCGIGCRITGVEDTRADRRWAAAGIASPLGGRVLSEVANGIATGLGSLRRPARQLLENEDVLITVAEGLQSSKSGLFSNTVKGSHGDAATTYLWTIDDRGVNIALEQTPFPTPRGNIVHSNLSSEAYIGGEAWFTADNKVIINAGSGRFGDGAGITEENWHAAVRFWEELGYEVVAIPFGQR